jgi:hypothetical protein
MRIIIAGGRDFQDYELVKTTFFKVIEDAEIVVMDSITELFKCFEIVSGNAEGADELGERLAYSCGFKLKIFPARWDVHGGSAGYIRNEEMALYAKTDRQKGMLIAFWDGKSSGTKNMIENAKKHGLETVIVKY